MITERYRAYFIYSSAGSFDLRKGKQANAGMM